MRATKASDKPRSHERPATMSTISTALGYSTARVHIQANPMHLAHCDIIAETEKAIQICSVDCKSTCWLPKSALKPYNPGVPTYEGYYTIAGWFWRKMNHYQARVLNYP